MAETFHNWAGNIAYQTRDIRAPKSVAELQAIVRAAPKLRALGSRHSFNAITDTTGTLVSMRGLTGVRAIDPAAQTVTVEGGITYGELAPQLDAAGFALKNLASLPHIAVVGAVSTATHGSGVRNQNLSTAVAALEIVTATGDIVTLRRGDADFAGAVVGLGALGVVSAVTLDIVPRFTARQNLVMDLPFAALVDNFEAIAGAAYSVSAFTRWRGETVDMVWLKTLGDAAPPPADFYGATPATREYHPLASLDPAPATAQLGVAGPWYERLPHFRMDFKPSLGAELQAEYFLARAHAPAALRALKAIDTTIAPKLLVSEVRTIAADALWLSPANGLDCVAFHFTFESDWPAVAPVLTAIEAALAPFAVMPHWGKLFTMDKATLRTRYKRLGDFAALARRYDPAGKFRNRFLDETVF